MLGLAYPSSWDTETARNSSAIGTYDRQPSEDAHHTHTVADYPNPVGHMVGMSDIEPALLPLKVFEKLSELSNLANASESEQEQLVVVRRQLLLLRALHQVC